jgi:phosphoserine aminotransferase
MGGLSVLHKLNQEKARLLYDELDRNKLFVATVKEEEDRSIMNVTFVMAEEYTDLEKNFLEFATNKGMVGIKGHRSVGGFRASIYNAMTKEGVQALIDVMKEFEASH